MSATLLGLAAGLGIAVPLGAVGVLLLRTGMTHGWRPAAAGALGVATVDLAYATVAVLAGAAVTQVLSGYEPIVRAVGGLVLATIAARGLLRLRGPMTEPADAPVTRARGTFARFVGLTLINPLTAVYFAAVVAGLTTRLSGAGERVAFVIGVAVGSAAWQLVLAGAGSLAGLRAGPRLRTVLGAVGDLVVLGLAAVVAFG